MELSIEQHQALLKVLKLRFEKHINRHGDLEWAKIQAKLDAHPEKLWSLHEMESTGGEPDVIGYDKKTGEYLFYDCSAESPTMGHHLIMLLEGFVARLECKFRAASAGFLQNNHVPLHNPLDHMPYYPAC